MKVRVIFSSFGKAHHSPVLQSLEQFSEFSVTCLTSRVYRKSWRLRGVETHHTIFNPMSKSSKVLRFLLRKRLLLIIFFLPKLIFEFKFLRNIFVVPHNLRHFLALEVLRKIDPEDYVFLVDSRDLIFQVSPIDIARLLDTENKTNLFDEGPNYFRNNLPQDFIHSKANYEWLQKLLNYPKDFGLFDLESPIVNSGCMAGKAKDLISVLSLTTDLISKSRYGVESLLDQAALNVVAYGTNNSGNLFTINKNGSVVLNMCGVVNEKVEIVNGKLMLNGAVIPIVHQFDRFGIYSIEKGLILNRRKYKTNLI